ncbi:PEP-CTERM sorting domain-containing protein [Rhodoferax mekongensis]|uniref:PEP-CTERM sorting domain-containing protein n=1 Tax=Rhodoferax mekongensis TaxID=3068341 RepID=A0ABZ0B5T9_9BURK|nr:PEP-CTERM sorting domain-containing protein [Rhodoferax sp. TBRC 17307]WNO06242.1 PEP-CTERM sorting domain-containing protein [Rhodoferax sp. TBRC 17307]
MKLQYMQALCAAALALGSAVSANALTLTFDEMSSPADAASYGVVLQHSSDNHYVVPSAGFVSNAGGGSVLAYYGLGAHSETLTLLPSLNSLFSLNSLDLAGLMGSGGGQLSDQFSIRISGIRMDGTQVGGLHAFSLTPGTFTHYGSNHFTGFTGLKSVTFSGIGTDAARYVGVDNIALTISPVPEPETYALLLAGLGLLAAASRRRRAD